jgi:SPP1 family predicted phage head-tail adaptor
MKADASYLSRMRHRMMLQRAELTEQQGGQFDAAWEDVAEVWAMISPVASRSVAQEQMRDGQLVSPLTHEVHIRYRAGVEAGMRLLWGARVFDIKQVVNVQERDVMLWLLAEESQ